MNQPRRDTDRSATSSPTFRSLRWVPGLGPLALAVLACGANACGSGSTSTGTTGPGSSSGSSSGYGTSSGGSSSGFNTSSSGSGSSSGAATDDASDDADATASDDGSMGADTTSGDDGSSSGGEAGDDSAAGEGGSSGADASSGSSSSSSGGADASSSGSGSGSSSSGSGSGSSGSSSGSSSSSSSSGSSSGGVDASSSSSSGSSSGGADSGSDAASGCNLTGAWAVKITVHVTWPGTLLLTASPTAAAQQPTAELWALIQGTQSGLSVPGTVEACGLDLPDFTSALPGETYGVTFANSMWDMLSASTGTITLSNTTTTAAYDSTVNTTLIGIGTTPTAWTAWPSLAVAETDEVDSDHDGEWGVTATPKTGTPPGGGGNTYADPPTGIPGAFQPFIRADSLYMGLRSVLSLGGNLTSCTAASGNATVTAMDNHIIGCHIAGQPTADAGANYCNSTQTSFLDTNSPHLVPHAATFTAVKMTTAATCANARAAIP